MMYGTIEITDNLGTEENPISDVNYLSPPINSRPKCIIAAAILRDGKLWTGKRHCDIMKRIYKKYPELYIRDDEKGFITDELRFVMRSAAVGVAIKAGQLDRSFDKTLLSEDLWK